METKKAAPKDGLNRSIAPTDYTPTFPPKKDSVTAETLARLLDGQTITQREAYDRLSTVNIPRTMFDLRRYGWPVITSPRRIAHPRRTHCHLCALFPLLGRYRQVCRPAIHLVYAARKARRAQ